VGYGAAVTFLPSVTGRTSSWSIFALSAALVVTRWTSGRVNGWGSRKGLILLADLMIVIGLGAFFVSSVRSHSALDVIAALVFGAGFGIVTTGSYSSFLENSSSDGFLTGAVIWNIVFDAGIGFGGLATAPIAHAEGYGDVFGAVAALAVCAGVVGLNLRGRDQNSQSSSRSDR
jgi:predicted MFS family arabinose efflux permease